MSGYQYYEFRALDRPLDAAAMTSLRSLSSRAEISPTRLAVTHNYGSFRGDPVQLVSEHFDLMVYVSNRGTRKLQVRLPSGVLTPAQIKPYLAEDSLLLHPGKKHLVIEFLLQVEGGGYWVDEREGPEAIEELLPLREMLLKGDLGPLYVAWLSSHAFRIHEDAEDDEDEDDIDEDEGERDEPEHSDEREPPVPAGLRRPAPALAFLASFLGIPTSLLEAAAEASAEATDDAGSTATFEKWLAAVPARQQTDWLTRLAWQQEPGVGAEVMRAYRASLPGPAKAASGRRTVAQLVALAHARENELKQRAAAARKKQKEELEKKKQAQRQALEANPALGWEQIEELVATKEEANYDQAVELLLTLRDIAQKTSNSDDFKRRLKEVRQRHVSKTKFHQKMGQHKLYAR